MQLQTAPNAIAGQRTVHILTYGCQMNDYESDRTYRTLRDQMGYTWSESPESADLVIFNTCSIREKADHKALSDLGRLKISKSKRPEKIIAVGGCMAQMQGEELQTRFPYVDLVFGTHQWNRLPEFIQKIEIDRRRATEIDLFGWQNYSFLPVPSKAGATSVSELITIQNGCDKFCTFCLVPFTRGRQMSRSIHEIEAEIRLLVENGAKEVILLGQNVNAYGRDKRGEPSFADLLRRVAAVDGLERIRFVTSHPAELNSEIISAMAEEKKVCNSLHLPLQSGSNEVLRRMNRSYTIEHYANIVHELKSKIANLTLTTDMIVGFPGETDAQFEESMKALERFRFHDSFSFWYSPRPHTKAADWSDEFVPLEIAKERLTRYQALQREYTDSYRKALVGTTDTVLVEGPAARGEGAMAGKTTTQWTVNFLGDRNLIGKLVKVRIDESVGNTLRGTEVAS